MYEKILEDLLISVVEVGASDIHLSVGMRPFLRIAGQLTPVSQKSVLSQKDTAGIVEAMLGKENFEVFLQKKEADFSYSFKDKARFRVNVFFQKRYIGLAMRLIPFQIRTVEELLLPKTLLEFTRKEQGFFLVVGPTGHGKSTTLAALVDQINRDRAEHIVTIEDPIEYIFTPERSIIDQREVGLDTESFSRALKSVFRQDINVGMIGEMRDYDTMATAVTAAETGHLIFSSLHTNNASQTIDRIIDSFPAEQQDQIRAQLAVSLLGIFSQRLIPRITGGLVPAFELLLNNNAVSNLIREKRTHEIDVVIETGTEAGMIDLNHSLLELVRAGEISIEDAYQYSLNPKGIKRMM